jgi:hypothetical protein
LHIRTSCLEITTFLSCQGSLCSTFRRIFVLELQLSHGNHSVYRLLHSIGAYCPSYNRGPSWQWSYGIWIYNYLCNQCLSPLLWVRSRSGQGVQHYVIKVCQRFATGQWFSLDPPVSSINKTDRHDTEILLKVALNTIKQTNIHSIQCISCISKLFLFKSFGRYFKREMLTIHRNGYTHIYDTAVIHFPV